MVGDVAEEVNKLADAEFFTKRYELVAVGASAGNEQAHVGLRMTLEDKGESTDEGVDAVAVFKSLDVADDKCGGLLVRGYGAESLHVHAEGGDGDGLGSVEVCLAGHAVAGGEDMVGLLKGEGEKMAVE